MGKLLIGVVVLLLIIGAVSFMLRDKPDLAPKKETTDKSTAPSSAQTEPEKSPNSLTTSVLSGGVFCETPECLMFKDKLIEAG